MVVLRRNTMFSDPHKQRGELNKRGTPWGHPLPMESTQPRQGWKNSDSPCSAIPSKGSPLTLKAAHKKEFCPLFQREKLGLRKVKSMPRIPAGLRKTGSLCLHSAPGEALYWWAARGGSIFWKPEASLSQVK